MKKRIHVASRNFFIIHQDTIINFLFAVVCLLLYSLFPTGNAIQKFFSNVAFFLAVPILYVKIILKKDLKNFGLQVGNWKQGLIWSILSLIVLFLLLYLANAYTGFSTQKDYIMGLAQSFWIYLAYEAILIPFLFIYEFFFRGFVMFGISKRMQGWAIITQAVFFLIFFFLGGNFNWSNFYFLILTVFSGIIAYKSRSILYSFATGIIFICLADAYLISLFLKSIK
jgi:membrane protease YdiL (CAAX protease family)